MDTSICSVTCSDSTCILNRESYCPLKAIEIGRGGVCNSRMERQDIHAGKFIPAYQLGIRKTFRLPGDNKIYIRVTPLLDGNYNKYPGVVYCPYGLEDSERRWAVESGLGPYVQVEAI